MFKKLNAIIFIVLALVCTVNAQDCNCTIEEVQDNSVMSCNRLIGDIINVSTTAELRAAIIQVNQSGGNMTILLADGVYPVASTSWYPYITASNLVIRSASGQRDNVVISGQGMQSVAPGTEIGLSLVGDNITVADLTIRAVGNHGISTNSDDHFIHNVRFQDTYEQMIKGTSGGDNSTDVTVQCSLFEYTAGIGPWYYIGGLDIHEGVNWQVHDNIFIDIASPSGSEAEHAVHFWDNSLNNTVERNWIINCDRGIGFGLGSSQNTGGLIKNNMIYNEGSHPFNDVGIGLETSPNTIVANNTIHIAYQNAIEYRFVSTSNVEITNNLVNRRIHSRNGGTATLLTNIDNAAANWYVDTDNGDLHLATMHDAVVNRGTAIPAIVSLDFDQGSRPQGNGYDIGAQEWMEGLVDQDMDGFASDVDCDDMNGDVNPDAVEVPYDGIDNDCDPLTLDDDLDMDGFINAEDCDDENAMINPDAIEVVYDGLDNDCDPLTLDDDLDMDGFVNAEDCDDENAMINPDAIEVVYDGFDNDCDPLTLDDDLDMDGFINSEDCDDENDMINPNAIEVVYDGIDNDCDPLTLDDDLDMDGFINAEDCDDENAMINPDAIEVVYDGIDNDCDPLTLDDDLDMDGFINAEDCDDANAMINPDAIEIPNNGIDEDCDGQDLITSTEELEDFGVVIYPNPTSGILNIDGRQLINYKVTIINSVGVKVLECYNCDRLDLSNLMNGVYHVEIKEKNNGISVSKRVVLVK